MRQGFDEVLPLIASSNTASIEQQITVFIQGIAQKRKFRSIEVKVGTV